MIRGKVQVVGFHDTTRFRVVPASIFVRNRSIPKREHTEGAEYDVAVQQNINEYAKTRLI